MAEVGPVVREQGLIEGPDGTSDLTAVRGDRLAGGVVDEGAYRLTDKGHQQLATLDAMLPPDALDTIC
jgi:hypothetical protein